MPPLTVKWVKFIFNPSKECLFIGDDFENDFYAPRQIGTGLTVFFYLAISGIMIQLGNPGDRNNIP